MSKPPLPWKRCYEEYGEFTTFPGAACDYHGYFIPEAEAERLAALADRVHLAEEAAIAAITAFNSCGEVMISDDVWAQEIDLELVDKAEKLLGKFLGLKDEE